METITEINSINQLHRLLGYEKPKHPLVSVVDFSKIQPSEILLQNKCVLNLYLICLKIDNPKSFQYGRNHYDYEEGTMLFMSPQQAFALNSPEQQNDYTGWGLFFHLDFIINYSLANKIKKFSFFSYNVSEGLHLSEDEKTTVSNIVDNIYKEYSNNIDQYSQDLIVTGIEQLLNYSQRFYGRQFMIRKKQNNDLVSRFETLLSNHFQSNHNQPTVEYFADKLNLSQGYLADLLKKETGKTTKEHIQIQVIENAKYRLLNSNDTVNEIAYSLGFEYPQYFNRLFKQKTGITPMEYRQLN